MAVIERHPGQSQALETLANFAEQFDDFEAAVTLLQSCAQLDPSNLGVRLRLAEGLTKLGRNVEADGVLAALASQFGSTPDLHIVRARILSSRGDYKAAREILAEGSVAFSLRVRALVSACHGARSCGDYQSARRNLELPPLCSALEQTRVRLLHGEVAAAEWRLDAALSHYTEALEFNPNDAWLNNCAARVSLLMADTKLALRHLEASVRYSSSHRVLQQGSWKPSQTHIGQMLDEYRIDRKALDRLHRCLTSSDPAGALSQMMIAYPDYTPAAISLLISLRQTGRLVSLDSIKDKKTSLIPATIAQYWDVDIPADVEALCDGWRAMHPSFSYIRFSKAGARRFLIEKGLPEALAAFDRAAEPAMQADIFRLAYLFHEGGYYIDADDRCIAPISTLEPGDRDLILYQEDFGTVGNDFIGVRPRASGHGKRACERRDGCQSWRRGHRLAGDWTRAADAQPCRLSGGKPPGGSRHDADRGAPRIVPHRSDSYDDGL